MVLVVVDGFLVVVFVVVLGFFWVVFGFEVVVVVVFGLGLIELELETVVGFLVDVVAVVVVVVVLLVVVCRLVTFLVGALSMQHFMLADGQAISSNTS